MIFFSKRNRKKDQKSATRPKRSVLGEFCFDPAFKRTSSYATKPEQDHQEKRVTAFITPDIMVDTPIQPIDNSLVFAATSETAEAEKIQNDKTPLKKKTKTDKVDEHSGAPHHADGSSICSEVNKIKDEVKVSRRSNASSYVDYSRVPPSGSNSVASIFKAASAKEPTFPVKLHLILSNPEFEDIISWMPHGRSWRILRPDVFEDRILPLFFCHCRLSSFMRQVNGWGFRRIKHGPDYNSYYHERFLRGLTHLAESMRRESVTAKSKGAEGEDEPAPDLYKISGENPLPENPTLAEYRRKNAASSDPTASILSGVHLTPTALATGQMPSVTQDMALKPASFGVSGLGAISALPTMPNSTPLASTLPSSASPHLNSANQAELLNAYRSARMLEQQRLAAMSNTGFYGGGVGLLGALTDQMYKGTTTGPSTMAQMNFQNRLQFGGMPGVLSGVIQGMPGVMVGSEVNPLAYQQVSFPSQAAGWRPDIASNFYQQDSNLYNGAFAQPVPQLDFNMTVQQQLQQLQQLRNSNIAQMGTGLLNHPGGPSLN